MKLTHEIVEAEIPATGRPQRTLWFLHGLLGRGRNWRTLCRRAVAARPWYRGVLLDLRCHGDNPPTPGPHDLKAAAQDLADTAAAIGMPDVVAGHSLGGKVALEWLRSCNVPETVLTFVLDSPPGAAAVEGGPAAHILRTLRAIPLPAPTRDALRAPLRAAGLAEPIVAWLLSSTRQDADGWRWIWDLEGAAALLASHRLTDFWPFLASTTRPIHLVRGGLSEAWTARDLERAAATEGSTGLPLQGRSGPFSASWPAGPRPVRAHVLQTAGHWVHTDDPEGTLALLVSWLER